MAALWILCSLLGTEAVAQTTPGSIQAEVPRKVSPAGECIAMVIRADTLLRGGDREAAKRELLKASMVVGAPAYLIDEVAGRLRELERGSAKPANKESASEHFQLPPVGKNPLTLHVAPKGSDGNPGTKAKPLATVEGARDAIRTLRRGGQRLDAGVLVLVHGGDYPATRTLKLSAEDSGTAASPLVFRAAARESPRFVGGLALSGFSPITDAEVLARLPRVSAGKVVELNLKANGVTNLLPLVLGGFASGRGFRTHPAHEVFFNGHPLQLARGPNEGFLRLSEVVVKDGTKGYDREGSKTGKFIFQGGQLPQWANEPDLLLYGYWFWDWADSYERVAKIDPNQGLITLAEPWHTYGYSVGAPFYAINALSELDAPGEYYLDRQRLRLYFYPASELAKAKVEISTLAVPMLELDGVSHVRFEGLTWDLGCHDAIHVRGGTNCILAGCTVTRFAGNGVEVRGGRGHVLLSCDIHSMGRGGTIVTGGDRKTLAPGGHVVENCDIYDLSRIDHTYTPAVVVDGVGNRITHNRLHDVRSSAMRVGGNDHRVEFNEVFNAVTESDDQGGVDMFGNPTYRGNVYRYNYWHHIGNWRGVGENPKCGQAGIRLDDAISGTLIYANIFEHCSAGKLGFGGVQVHGGKDNLIDNNLFLDCAAGISFSPWDEAHWRAYVAPTLDNPEIDRGLYLQRYPDLAHLGAPPNTNHLYRNVFIRCGEMLRRAPNSLELLGNQTVKDDAFSLRTNRALPNLPGFAPIPIETIGLYSDPFRATKRRTTAPSN